MKTLLGISLLFSVLIVTGCKSDDRQEVAPPPLATATDPNAAAIAKKNQENASIDQKIHQTGILPNGQHVPTHP